MYPIFALMRIALGMGLFLAALPASAVTIPTVPVGNPGNAGELTGNSAGGSGPDAIAGGVNYRYRIGTYEVTNSEYAEFLNAKAASDPLSLYSTAMDFNISRSGSDGNYTYTVLPGRGNFPVIFVSWYDAIRFTNWLDNGQGNGDTETGAYALGPLHSTGMPVNDPQSITRNAGAIWWLPNEDEWYKAAYHKNDGVTGNYFDFPTSSDTAPTSEAPPGGSNSANYHFDLAESTDVGAYNESDSPYSTFDQGGNVTEWIDTIIGSNPGQRGGSAEYFGGSPLHAAYREWLGLAAGAETHFGGFRVATIPEPSTAVLAAIGLVVVAMRVWLTKRGATVRFIPWLSHRGSLSARHR